MTEITSLQPRRLACYTCDDQTNSLINGIDFKDFNISLETYDGGIAYAISHLKGNKSPDILIVDISKSSMPLSDLSSLAEVCEPRVEVIVIGEKNDVGLFRNLIKSGVRDYLVKPLLDTILMKSITEIIHNEGSLSATLKETKSGKIITFLGSCGGIGVSSIVANLGAELSEAHGKRAIIADLDLQTGTIPLFLDQEPSDGFSQIFEHPDRIDRVLLDRYATHYKENLSVLSAELSFLEKPKIKMDSVDALLSLIAPQYHYTLIDLPRHFSDPLIAHVLSKSNQLVVLCNYSMTSLRDTCRILQMAKGFPNLNHGIVVLANRVGEYKKGEIERATFEETIQRPVSMEIKFDPIHPLQSLLDGEPTVIQGKGIMAQGIQALAKSIIGMGTNSKKSKSKGKLGNLLKLLKAS